MSLPVTCPPEYSASTNIPIAPKEKQGTCMLDLSLKKLSYECMKE